MPVVFAEQVRRAPDAIAVVGGGVSWSYAELDARANRLAHRLIRLGVRAEHPVGGLMERSADLVLAELAVVKAGGAYLPVDLRAPAERMRSVLTQAGVSVLLTDREWQAAASSVHRGHVLVVDTDSLRDEPHSDPGVVVDPEQLAYVMYTSGSTGVPKGVAVRHRDVVALAFDRCFRGDAMSGCCCTRRRRSTRRPMSCGCRCCGGVRWWWRRRRWMPASCGRRSSSIE